MLETIVALATPLMKSALAVIRVSGKDTFEIMGKITHKDFSKYQTRTIVHAKIYDSKNEEVDDVIVNVYINPKSFTGEDLCEIMCHGSPLICNEIIELIIGYGARYAERGEFSSRAYLNDKVDLIQAEAINDVINATTKEAKRLSLLSLEGDTSKVLLPVKTKIADLLSLIEVNIDYPEYQDIEQVNVEKIVKDTTEIHEMLQTLIDDGKKGKIIREGLNVVIVGKPNVGKSSLLNALLNEDKAIVTSIAGTTRDIVEGDVSVGGIALHLIDTAGVHETSDYIESIGINKTREMIGKADLALIVLDASQPLDLIDQELINETKNVNRILIYNKKDLISEDDRLQGAVYISAEDKDIKDLEKEIIKLYGITPDSYTKPSLNNARQIGTLLTCDNDLLQARSDALKGLPIDLVSVSLQNAYHSILNCLGEAHDNDITKEIFARFCVGK